MSLLLYLLIIRRKALLLNDEVIVMDTVNIRQIIVESWHQFLSIKDIVYLTVVTSSLSVLSSRAEHYDVQWHWIAVVVGGETCRCWVNTAVLIIFLFSPCCHDVINQSECVWHAVWHHGCCICAPPTCRRKSNVRGHHDSMCLSTFVTSYI